MVNLTKDGICIDCPYPHLYFERLDGEDEELGTTYSYSVGCRHHDACMRAYDIGMKVTELKKTFGVTLERIGDSNENSGSGSDI